MEAAKRKTENKGRSGQTALYDVSPNWTPPTKFKPTKTARRYVKGISFEVCN